MKVKKQAVFYQLSSFFSKSHFNLFQNDDYACIEQSTEKKALLLNPLMATFSGVSKLVSEISDVLRFMNSYFSLYPLWFLSTMSLIKTLTLISFYVLNSVTIV